MSERRESQPAPTEVKPRLAATAIVLREHDGEVQVLMARRHASLAFMGGMWVFPGGALSEADRKAAASASSAMPNRCPFQLNDIAGAPLPPDLCTALAIAAVRETFEEAGILLALRRDGQPPHGDQLERLHAERTALTADPALFMAALAKEELVLALDRLISWAHWITPSGLARRFDTRFFVTRAPQAHTHAADSHETSECAWLAPSQLLERAAHGEMIVAQPTRYTLVDLQASIERHRTLDALMRAESRRQVAAIMPKLVKQDGSTAIVLPWDLEYAAIPGEGVRTDQQFEPALLALPSRVERDH
jgi:8-oxo-dGTP pyrophosphatase MutT (NUDIX family)